MEEILAPCRRLLIISDSHGSSFADQLPDLLREEKADALVHLGDMKEGPKSGLSDYALIARLISGHPQMPFVLINGGDDWDDGLSATVKTHGKARLGFRFAEGGLFFIHDLGVRGGALFPEVRSALSAMQGAPIAFHGHTHRQELSKLPWPLPEAVPLPEKVAHVCGKEIPLPAGTVWFINPGALENNCYAVFTRDDGESMVRFTSIAR